MFRQKSYSAETGYVYQYVYEGRQDAPGGSRYVFHASSDRRTTFPLVIFLPDAALESWQNQHRPLTVNERYAIAKLSLIRAFDELPPAELSAEFEVTPALIREISDTLGLI